jgi:hypothetical protein
VAKSQQQMIAELMVAAHGITPELAEFHAGEMDKDELAARLIMYIKNGVALADNWYPASGGTETEFHTRGGYRLLYVWQPSTGKHAYLNLDTDIVLSDDDAMHALGVY